MSDTTSPAPEYEPLVDTSDIDSDVPVESRIDLQAMVPRESASRRGLFTRALKYMNYIAGEGRQRL